MAVPCMPFLFLNSKKEAWLSQRSLEKVAADTVLGGGRQLSDCILGQKSLFTFSWKLGYLLHSCLNKEICFWVLVICQRVKINSVRKQTKNKSIFVFHHSMKFPFFPSQPFFIASFPQNYKFLHSSFHQYVKYYFPTSSEGETVYSSHQNGFLTGSHWYCDSTCNCTNDIHFYFLGRKQIWILFRINTHRSCCLQE